MFYRWIVIENSLKDKSIIKKYPILSVTKFASGDPKRESRILKIRIPEKDVQKLSDSLKENLIYPYYTHFYHEDSKKNNLIVVFSNKKFLTSKDNYKTALDYGLANDVSSEEIAINPRDISQEDW